MSEEYNEIHRQAMDAMRIPPTNWWTDYVVLCDYRGVAKVRILAGGAFALQITHVCKGYSLD